VGNLRSDMREEAFYQSLLTDVRLSNTEANPVKNFDVEKTM